MSVESEKTYSSEVLSPISFVKDFSTEVRHARSRAWTQSMLAQTGHGPDIIEHSLKVAAGNGVDARRVRDYFSEVVISGSTREERKEVKLQDKEAERKMVDAGVGLATVNKSLLARFFPFIHRDHRKVHVSDSTAWFGGVNVDADHLTRADFVVRLTEPAVVLALADLFTQTGDNKPKRDYKRRINDEYALWVDHGKIGKSIIYKRARDMVADASDSIRFISQLPPSWRLLKKLVEASDRGVDVSIILPSPEQYMKRQSFPINLISKFGNWRFEKAIYEHKNTHVTRFKEHNEIVHGKMLITDEKRALWGSHNFAETGVWAGTQEADLETTDQPLVRKLTDWFDSIPNGTYDLGYQESPFHSKTGEFTLG